MLSLWYFVLLFLVSLVLLASLLLVATLCWRCFALEIVVFADVTVVFLIVICWHPGCVWRHSTKMESTLLLAVLLLLASLKWLVSPGVAAVAVCVCERGEGLE
jgi:hypothetical protein